MDKDRIKGSAQQAKGKIKEVAGKVSGDAKLESEGKADKASGKVRNAIGVQGYASRQVGSGKHAHRPCGALRSNHPTSET
jgi:uncharacterized protein YjbJ (UPF0337 family)